MIQVSINLARIVSLLFLSFLSLSQNIEAASGEIEGLSLKRVKVMSTRSQELCSKLSRLPFRPARYIKKGGEVHYEPANISLEELNSVFGNIYSAETLEGMPLIRIAHLIEEFLHVRSLDSFIIIPSEFSAEVDAFKLFINRTVKSLIRLNIDLERFTSGSLAADIFGRRGLIGSFNCLIRAGVGSQFSPELNLYHSLIDLLEKIQGDSQSYPSEIELFSDVVATMLDLNINGFLKPDFMGRTGLDLALTLDPLLMGADEINKLEELGCDFNAVDRWGNNIFHRLGKSTHCNLNADLLRQQYLLNQAAIITKNKAELYPIETESILTAFYLSTLDPALDLNRPQMAAAVRQCLFQDRDPDGKIRIKSTSMETLGGAGIMLFQNSIDTQDEGEYLEDREDNRSLLLIGFNILDSLKRENNRKFEDASIIWSELLLKIVEDYFTRWKRLGTFTDLIRNNPHKEFLALVVGTQILERFDGFDTDFNERDPEARFPQLVRHRLSQRVRATYARILRPKDGPGFTLVTYERLRQFYIRASQVNVPGFPVFPEISFEKILNEINQSDTLKLLANLNQGSPLKFRGSEYLKELAVMPHPLRGTTDLNSPALEVLHYWLEDLESTIIFFSERGFKDPKVLDLSKAVEWMLRLAASNLRNLLFDVDKELFEQAAKNIHEPGVCQFLVNLASLPAGPSKLIEECLRPNTLLNHNEVNPYQSLREGF